MPRNIFGKKPPRDFRSEDLRPINSVSNKTIAWKHSFNSDTHLRDIYGDNLEACTRNEELIAPMHLVYKAGARLSKAIRARYEKGVLRPLSSVNLEEGKEYKVIVEEDIDELIKKYRGVLRKSSVEECRELEEEAQTQ